MWVRVFPIDPRCYLLFPDTTGSVLLCLDDLVGTPLLTSKLLVGVEILLATYDSSKDSKDTTMPLYAVVALLMQICLSNSNLAMKRTNSFYKKHPKN